MKSVLLEMTDTMDGLHSRLDSAEEKQGILDGRSV